jgi:hypothetical protein
MTEHDFRRLNDHSFVVRVEAKWEMTGADTSREWLEVETRDSKRFVLPHNWAKAWKFAGHASNPGLFRLTYEGEQMAKTLAVIDAWEAKNAADRAEFERLKAKFNGPA